MYLCASFTNFMIKNRTFQSLSFFLFSFIFTLNVFGQVEKELDEVVVSTPKFLSKLSSTGKVVDILDSTILRQNIGKNLGEILSQQASVMVNGSRSNPGTNQELYMRGASTGQVLVLLDGFPLNDPSQITQVFDWNLIDVRSLERIEIIRGGLSSLYGSDAMVAVINLVSQKSTRENFGGEVGLLAGSFNTIQPKIRLNGNDSGYSWMLKYNVLKTQGISSADVPGGEKDGYFQQNFRVSVQKDYKKWGFLEVYGIFSGNNLNLDAGPNLDERDYTAQTNHRSFRALWTKSYAHFTWQQKYFIDRTSRIFLNDSLEILPMAMSKFYRADYTGWSSGYENFLKFDDIFGGTGILGFEVRMQKTRQSEKLIGEGWEYISQPIEPALANQKLFAFYGAYEKVWNQKWGLELSGRANYQSKFGSFYTYSLNPFLNISSKLKFFSNVYSGFKIPSLYQLFSPYGNLSLKPEQSFNFESGVKWTWQSTKIQLVYFDNFLRDGIIFSYEDAHPDGIYVNYSTQKIRGLEFNMEYRWGRFNFQGNASYLKGKTKMKPEELEQSVLVRRPNFKTSLAVNTKFNSHWNVNLAYNYLGKRIDSYFDDLDYQVKSVDLGTYSLVDIQVNFAVNDRVDLSLIGRNILNKKYEETFGYSSLPRTIFINLNYRF